MKKGSGKAKGSQFERDICKALSLWVSDGKSIDLFWRSAMSGGRATVKRGLVRQAGDITAVAREGHALADKFVIECKAYKELSLDCLVKGKGTLIDFWKVVVTEGGRHTKFPMLIFKRNNWPILVCLSAGGVNILQAQALVFLQSGNMCFVKFDELVKKGFLL